MEWRNAGKRTKLGIVDGSVLAPLVLAMVVFHYITIALLVLYSLTNVYISMRGRSMSWVLKRARYFLRDGIILARSGSYWRRVLR